MLIQRKIPHLLFRTRFLTKLLFTKYDLYVPWTNATRQKQKSIKKQLGMKFLENIKLFIIIRYIISEDICAILDGLLYWIYKAQSPKPNKCLGDFAFLLATVKNYLSDSFADSFFHYFCGSSLHHHTTYYIYYIYEIYK
jgi:hypothetical protein